LVPDALVRPGIAGVAGYAPAAAFGAGAIDAEPLAAADRRARVVLQLCVVCAGAGSPDARHHAVDDPDRADHVDAGQYVGLPGAFRYRPVAGPGDPAGRLRIVLQSAPGGAVHPAERLHP